MAVEGEEEVDLEGGGEGEVALEVGEVGSEVAGVAVCGGGAEVVEEGEGGGVEGG